MGNYQQAGARLFVVPAQDQEPQDGRLDFKKQKDWTTHHWD